MANARREVVDRLAVGQPRPELLGLPAQLGVGETGEVVLDRVDLDDDAFEALDDLAFTGAEDLVDQDRHAEVQLLDSRM